jgi:hypothetical protein
MYIIDVRPVSDILPSMFAVNFEPYPSYLGATDIVLTLAPESDVEKAFQFFPEYICEGRPGPIHEIESAEIRGGGAGFRSNSGGGVWKNRGRMPSRS